MGVKVLKVSWSISMGLILFINAKSKFDLKISPVLLLCQKTLSTRCVPFYVSFQINGVVGQKSEYIKHSNPKTKWVRFSGTPCMKR